MPGPSRAGGREGVHRRPQDGARAPDMGVPEKEPGLQPAALLRGGGGGAQSGAASLLFGQADGAGGEIVGSEGRYADFDDEFLPLKDSSEEKWRSLYAALRRGEELPPVSLLKVGDAYFVRDGNHRVSVARWRGVEVLDAEVVEVSAAVPVGAAISARDLPEGRRHLRPPVDPLYGRPAVGSGRSERLTHSRRGGGDRACP
jgi:hypothetical protein